MPAGSIPGAIDLTSIKYNWRGEWKPSGVYSKNDVVRFQGRTFFCKTDKLFEQQLFGLDYGPGKVGSTATAAIGERIENALLATWEASSNVFIAGRVANANNIENIVPPTKRYYTEISKSATSTAAWDGHAYTREFLITSAMASARAVNLTDQMMFGLNTDPAANTSFTSIDFAWYFDAGTCRIYENGSLISSHGTYTTGTDLTITFNGKVVEYWKDGVLQRTVVRAIGSPLYFDCSINTVNGTLTQVLFGPGNENPYWEEHTRGYLYRGGWMAYRRYYPGDIVKCRGDVYLCVRENFNGHPIYKNGQLLGSTELASLDWEKIASGTTASDDDYVEMLPNMPPLGWTRYLASWFEPGHQRTRFNARWFTASGKIYTTGRSDNIQNGGNGISTGQGTFGFCAPGASMSFEHFDHRYGRLPGHQGKPPRCIQLVGNGWWGAALFDNGEVYHWGYGAHGQNGDGTSNNNHYPSRCGYIAGVHDYRRTGTNAGDLATTRIVKLAGGGIVVDDPVHSMLALDSNGNVWAWGYNGFGQLGLGDIANRVRPTQIPREFFNDKSIVDIWTNQAGTNESIYAIDSEGRLWAWGYNGLGQLGLSHTKTVVPRPELVKYEWNKYGGIKKVQVVGKGTQGMAVVLTHDGTIHGVGDTSNTAGGDIFSPGSFHMGNTTVFRPYPDILKGYEQALGQEHRVKQAGAYIDVARNVEDFWIIGGEPSTHAIYVKEKGSGLIYSWGYNWNNSLMHTAHMWLRPADSGTYFTTNNYFPMPAAISAPDLTFIGRSMDRGYRTVVFITESGRAYSAGGNYEGDAGWGYNSTNGQSQLLIPGQNDYESMLSTEGSGNRTYFAVRQTERLAVCGGAFNYWDASNIPRGGFYWVSEDGILMHTGYQSRYTPAGAVKWGLEIIEGGDAYTPGAYAGISSMSNNYIPTKIWY